MINKRKNEKNIQQDQQQKSLAILQNLDNQHNHLNLEKRLNEPEITMKEKESIANDFANKNKLKNTDDTQNIQHKK